MAGPSLIATLGANISGFVRDLDTAQGHARSKGEGIGSALGSQLNSKLSGLISVAALEETIRRTVEYGSKINDLAIRLGISTDAVQQWDFALKQSGSSIESAAGFFEKLAVARDKVMAGGARGAVLAEDFQKLGISLEQLKTSRIEDIAATIAKAVESGDPQALIGPLREVGGRSAGELVTAFRDGLAESLTDAPLISAEDIAALDRAGDAWAKLKAEFTSSVAPIVAGITEAALGVIDFARLALAGPIGALMGLFDAISKFGIKDILSGKAFTETPKMIIEGAAEAIDAVQQQQKARDAADEDRKARLGKVRAGAFEEDDSKEQAKADKREKAALRAAEKLAEKEAAAQKKAELNQLKQQEKDAESQVRLERGARGIEINSLQRSGFVIGSLANAPEFALLDVQKRSEQHLSAIKQSIARLNNTRTSSGGDDTEF